MTDLDLDQNLDIEELESLFSTELDPEKIAQYLLAQRARIAKLEETNKAFAQYTLATQRNVEALWQKIEALEERKIVIP